MNHTPLRTVLSCTLLVMSLGAGATACLGDGGSPLAEKPYDATGQIAFNDPGKGKADPDKPLEITVKDDGVRITDVTAVDEDGRRLAGELSADGSRWHNTAPMAAGTRYTVRVSTENEDGAPGARTLTFETAATQKVLKVTFGPEKGTYGVGQPVTAELGAAVEDKAARAVVERALRVESEPAVEGSWHWVDGKNLHYRPKDYWPAGTVVRVHSNLKGIKVGKGLYGGNSAPLSLAIGDRIEALTDAAAHRMTVKRNGEVIKTIPVTTGKPGFATRNGIKVVLGKEYFVRMRGSTVGIPEGSDDAYDLPVYYATRVTWSGEYVHAAPWSVGSQGFANVSHGCTGMSTANASWFYDTIRKGDIVEVVGSLGSAMQPFGNGFGDWNLTWDKWRNGSALLTGMLDSGPTDTARLRPQV
ncbi:L,D-transpeptidase [Streptomyces sannanensis]